VIDIAAALEIPIDKLKTIPVAGCLLHARVVSAELAVCCETTEKTKPYLSGGIPMATLGKRQEKSEKKYKEGD
jgi:hypothetical protein